ncbi:hypothetical protein [Vallitalea okinawensis]|uniref:hypothetical protein n=1 Tax=Vallitalea okinawensis TaxID=2078660 RepID=UPI000CFDE22C|nr:hypothetical protein [Vallitalea okinawensis]
MKKNKLAKNMIFIGINAILFFIITIVYKDMQKAISLYDMVKLNLNIIFIGLILFAFGLLIEYDRINQIIKMGFKINRLKLLLAIIMLIISCLPYGFIYNINISIGELLNARPVRYLFSIWSGILVARALMDKEISF